MALQSAVRATFETNTGFKKSVILQVQYLIYLCKFCHLYKSSKILNDDTKNRNSLRLEQIVGRKQPLSQKCLGKNLPSSSSYALRVYIFLHLKKIQSFLRSHLLLNESIYGSNCRFLTFRIVFKCANKKYIFRHHINLK